MNKKTHLKGNDNSNPPIILSETSASSSIHFSSSYSYDCSSSSRHNFNQAKKKNEKLVNAKKINEADYSNLLSSQDYSSITNSDENYFSNYSTETKSYILHSDSEVSIKKRQKQNQNLNEKKKLPLPRYISSNNGPTESLPLRYAEKSNIADSKYWESIKTTDSCPEYQNSKEMPKFTHVVERPSSCCLLL